MVCRQQNVFNNRCRQTIQYIRFHNNMTYSLDILIRILDQDLILYNLTLKMVCRQQNVFLQSLSTTYTIH